MDLIRLKVRPQTPKPPPLPASLVPEPEGTGMLELAGELRGKAAAFLFGDGGSACRHSRGAWQDSSPALVSALLPMGGMAPRRGHELVLGRGLGCRPGGRAGKAREMEITGLKIKVNEKDRENGKDACMYPP